MDVGVIGAGAIGRAFAWHAVRAGHGVVLSNSRGKESLNSLVSDMGARARAGSVGEAAAADMVLLAVPWVRVAEVLGEVPSWAGRVLMDATNPVLFPDFRAADLEGRTSSEIVASLADGARVVKVANTLLSAMLEASPAVAGGRRVLFMSSDDMAAKEKVAALVSSMGFAPVDVGGLATGGRLQQFPGGTLPNLNLVKLG